MNYIQQLENQNEELQKKLSELEIYNIYFLPIWCKRIGRKDSKLNKPNVEVYSSPGVYIFGYIEPVADKWQANIWDDLYTEPQMFKTKEESKKYIELEFNRRCIARQKLKDNDVAI